MNFLYLTGDDTQKHQVCPELNHKFLEGFEILRKFQKFYKEVVEKNWIDLLCQYLLKSNLLLLNR